jgi:hypothetical protein
MTAAQTEIIVVPVLLLIWCATHFSLAMFDACGVTARDSIMLTGLVGGPEHKSAASIIKE